MEEEPQKKDDINSNITEYKEKLENYKIRFINTNSNFINDLKNLKETKISDIKFSASIEGLNSEVPFFGTYLEQIYKDLDPEEEEEDNNINNNNKERIFNNDQSFTWKFLRLLSEGDINKINTEEMYKLLGISEEYYKKCGLKDTDIKLNFKPLPPPPKIELKPKEEISLPKEEISLPKELLNTNNKMNIDNQDMSDKNKNKPVISLQNIIKNDNSNNKNNVIKNLSSDNGNITEIKVPTKKEEPKETIRLPLDLNKPINDNKNNKKEEISIINISTNNNDITPNKFVPKENASIHSQNKTNEPKEKNNDNNNNKKDENIKKIDVNKNNNNNDPFKQNEKKQEIKK